LFCIRHFSQIGCYPRITCKHIKLRNFIIFIY
jgi:hypothetical protein